MKINQIGSQPSLTKIPVQFTDSTAELGGLRGSLRRLGVPMIEADGITAFLDVWQLQRLQKELSSKDLQAIAEKQRIFWRGSGFEFDLTRRPIVYAIMNITPDSFYDGAPENLPLSAILKKAEDDLAAGAQVLELGGKSSRPGFEDISPAEEWGRLKEAVAILKKEHPTVPLAIDTNEADVMRWALEAGINIINDINGFETEDKLELLAQYKPSVVVMHNGRLAGNSVDSILPYFETKRDQLVGLGLASEQICIDTGVGFANGPSGPESLQRVQITPALDSLGVAVMSAISQKSLFDSVFGLANEERLVGTLLLSWQMLLDGARVLRVHNVAEARRLIDGFVHYKEG